MSAVKSIRLPLFNRFAATYDHLTDHRLWTAAVPRLLDVWSGPPPRRLLDIGCGPGGSTFALAQTLGESCEITGVDLAPAMVARAQRHLQRDWPGVRSVRFEVGDALRLAYADQSFDAITGHSFLYLVGARGQALRELRRVLRPGGMLMLLEPSRGAGLLGAWRSGMDEVPQGLSWPDRLHFAVMMTSWRMASATAGRLDATTVERLFAEAGLEPLPSRRAFGGLALRAAARRGMQGAGAPVGPIGPVDPSVSDSAAA